MTPGYRALIHASEYDRVPVALSNAENLFNELGEEAVEIRMVAYADGVLGFCADGPNTASMDRLADRGVQFVVCANSLRSRNLVKENFPDYVGTVPAGIAELVIRQAEGWSYVRP
ncbi:MAG: hypothetical protein GX885_06180 [Methanomicrobiales archaeon]|nr:hypothetical protein [Methanomicrobiales archaeon]